MCIQNTISPEENNKLFNTYALTEERAQNFETGFRKLLENESGYKLIVMLQAMHALYPQRRNREGYEVKNTIVLQHGRAKYIPGGYQYAKCKNSWGLITDEFAFDQIFYDVPQEGRIRFDAIASTDFKDYKDIYHESGHAFHSMIGIEGDSSYFMWSVLNSGSSSIIDLCYPLISPIRMHQYVASLKSIISKHFPGAMTVVQEPDVLVIDQVVSSGFFTALLLSGMDINNFSSVANNIDDKIKLAWVYASSCDSGGLWHRSGELLNISGLLVIKINGIVNLITCDQNEEAFLIRDDYNDGNEDEETKKYRFHDEEDFHRHGFVESDSYKDAVTDFKLRLFMALGIDTSTLDEDKYKEMSADLDSLIYSARFPEYFRFNRK